jgi:methylthioribose-1-phosphate isomerase
VLVKVDGVAMRTIWRAKDASAVEIIDQTALPHDLVIRRLENLGDAAEAIAAMRVRGAPLIGAAAAYGMALGMEADASDEGIEAAYRCLIATRPTAVNLRWALDEMGFVLRNTEPARRAAAAWRRAGEIADEDVAICEAIGDRGLALIERARAAKEGDDPVNLLTHCNAGWLATVDWGTALAPVYKAFDAGIDLHVWVDETRPRNQGAALSAWELGRHGVPHTVIVDNAGGHLMQRGQVDLCFVGTDCTTAAGDVCNKIGTYLKALAAKDCGVPFYVCLPGPTIDWTLTDGLTEIPIEERSAGEVLDVGGRAPGGEITQVSIAPRGAKAANPAFDVTPARLITALVTERGVCEPSAQGLASLYPEKAGAHG